MVSLRNFVYFIAFAFCIFEGRNASIISNSSSVGFYKGSKSFNRTSKFFPFPFLAVVKFSNDECMAGNDERGICYTRKHCTILGGINLGSCAQGYGVCCKQVARCGDTIIQNGTSFQNPDYPSKFSPSSGSTVCQGNIRRPRFNLISDICQVRLNFLQFDVDGPLAPPSINSNPNTPNDAGTCKTDFLSITGSSGTIPNFCGNLNGQHIYVDFGNTDTITMNLLLNSQVNKERTWNIEVLFIPCKSKVQAPPGCLQYFTGISGQVQSFNYQGGLHFGNMDYSICVRPEDGMRSIDWAPCQPGDVRISGSAGTGQTLPQACTTQGLVDYLMIPGGVSYPLQQTTTPPIPIGGSVTDRFCDMTFPISVPNAYVRSSVRPFILHFKTDNNELPQTSGQTGDASNGFCMRWQQTSQ